MREMAKDPCEPDPDRRRRAWTTAAAIAGCGLLARIILAFAIVPQWERSAGVPHDPDSYIVLARSLVDHGSFGFGSQGADPTTVRGPGYPAWLGLGILLGGDDPRWMGVWGGIPGLIVAAAIAFLLARRAGMLAAIIGGSIAAIHPIPAIVASRVMGDDFTAATGVAGLLVWDVALREKRRGRACALSAAAGLLLALHMLTRASGVLTLAAAAGFALARRPRRPAIAVLLVGVALLPPLLWSVRSSRLEGRFVFVHSLAAYNFWVGEALDRLGTGGEKGARWGEVTRLVLAQSGRSGEEADRFWYGDLTPRETAAFDGALARSAVRRVAQDPLGYAARAARGIAQFWYQAETRSRSWQYLIAALPVLILALAGAWSCLRGGGDGAFLAALLLAFILLHDAAYAATFPMARMSVQVYPALAYLAGCFRGTCGSGR